MTQLCYFVLFCVGLDTQNNTQKYCVLNLTQKINQKTMLVLHITAQVS